MSGVASSIDDDRLLEVLRDTAAAIREVLGELDDWGLAGTRPGQHRSDLVADSAGVARLTEAGLGVLSEESARHYPEREVCVVVDPLDGSTNGSRSIPWYAASLCAVGRDGLRASLVENLATGVRYEAVRGQGATRDGRPIGPSSTGQLSRSLVALSGFPPRHLGWKQYRAFGAAALDLCAIAEGAVDAYIDCTRNAHGPWDYLGAMLVCEEAGASVIDAEGRDLVVLDHEARRTPLAAATPDLLAEVQEARRLAFGGP